MGIDDQLIMVLRDIHHLCTQMYVHENARGYGNTPGITSLLDRLATKIDALQHMLAPPPKDQ